VLPPEIVRDRLTRSGALPVVQKLYLARRSTKPSSMSQPPSSPKSRKKKGKDEPPQELSQVEQQELIEKQQKRERKKREKAMMAARALQEGNLEELVEAGVLGEDDYGDPIVLDGTQTITLRYRKIIRQFPDDPEPEEEEEEDLDEDSDDEDLGEITAGEEFADEDEWVEESVSTLEFDPLECTFGFEVKDKKVPLPKNYVELQQRIAENYMRNLSLSHVLAIEWPDGTTVDPARAIFLPDDVITLREFIPHKIAAGARLQDVWPNKRDFDWDQQHECKLWTIKNLWGDEERACDPSSGRAKDDRFMFDTTNEKDIDGVPVARTKPEETGTYGPHFARGPKVFMKDGKPRKFKAKKEAPKPYMG
jgi:hypothetical protein